MCINCSVCINCFVGVPVLTCAYTHYSVSNTCYLQLVLLVTSSPNQMGSKAQPGAKGTAKAKAKASIGKAKAAGLAKAKAKPKASGKPKPKAASSSSGTQELGTRGGKGWDSIQQGKAMGQLGAQTVKDHLKRLVTQDPVKNKKLLDHYESLKGYSAKLTFALQLKVDKDGSFMTATETHSTASMDKSGFEDGWLEDSMVASKLGLLMWSNDKVHKDRLEDQLGIMEQRPHENPVLAAKGHLQYRWFRAKMREQDIVKQEKMEVKAQVAVETGKDFDSMVAQVMDHGESNFQSKGHKKPKPLKDEGVKLPQKQQDKIDWTKDAKTMQRNINQDTQTFLNFLAKGKVMSKDPMTGVTPQLMTNIKGCYDKVQAQSKVITEVLISGIETPWEAFDITGWKHKLDSIKAVLTQTNSTKDIGKRIIC